MFSRSTTWLSRLGVAALAAASLAIPVGAAGAASHTVVPGSPVTTTVAYDCRTTVQQGWHPVDYTRDFTVTAPASVTRRTAFDVVYDPAPITPYAEYNKTVTEVKVAYQLPLGAALDSYELSGGAGLGRAFTWVEKHGRTLLVTSSGPFTGGTEFDLPTLTVHLKSGAQRGTLAFAPGGSGYEDPSFFWFRHQPILDEWGPFQCFVDPATPVVLATTRVV